MQARLEAIQVFLKEKWIGAIECQKRKEKIVAKVNTTNATGD